MVFGKGVRGENLFQKLQPLGAVVSRLRDEDGSAGFPPEVFIN